MSYEVKKMSAHEADPEAFEREDYVTALVIIDNGEKRYHTDGGEREDQTFGRDWSWVERELKKAYEAGLRDAKEEKAT